MEGGKKTSKTYETYKKVSTLGVGSFGTAYLVECQSSGENAVIKQIDIQAMSEDERKETLREAKILEVLNHPNIVRFREVYKTKKGKLCIVMDYADGGDLQSKIKEKHKKKQTTGTLEYFSEEQVLSWFTQICLAIKHVHDRKILHRDLKSQNVFLTKRGLVKLGDFGIARVLSNTRSKAKTVVGTPYYLSPEIIESQPYNFKSDIWSLGVLLYEMCALQPPFNASSLHQLAQKIIQGKFDKLPRCYSNHLQNLVNALLTRDPRKRPNINEVLRMPIIARRISQFLDNNDFKDEFSHTLLHNHDVFKEFQRKQEEYKIKEQQREQEEKRKQEERQRQQEVQNQVLSQIRKQKEEEEARQKLSNLQLNQYRPPQEYYNQYQSVDFFQDQYAQYVAQLRNDMAAEQQYETVSTPKSSISSTVSDDRDDSISSASSQSDHESYHNPYEEAKDQQEMIDLYTCDYTQFADHMSKQYGEQPFREGFAIISKNKELIYTEEGEERLVKLMKHLFSSEDLIRGFLNFCTSYIIVQNYSQQMGGDNNFS